jgi:hypothetical protein
MRFTRGRSFRRRARRRRRDTSILGIVSGVIGRENGRQKDCVLAYIVIGA